MQRSSYINQIKHVYLGAHVGVSAMVQYKMFSVLIMRGNTPSGSGLVGAGGLSRVAVHCSLEASPGVMLIVTPALHGNTSRCRNILHLQSRIDVGCN